MGLRLSCQVTTSEDHSTRDDEAIVDAAWVGHHDRDPFTGPSCAQTRRNHLSSPLLAEQKAYPGMD